jgi:TRAP-type transport system small permease protein
LKEFLEKTSITVNKASQVVIFVFFVTAFLSTVYQVFSRFVLQSAFVQKILPIVDFSVFNLTWIEELIRYLFVWIVFLGIGVVYKSSLFVCLDCLFGNWSCLQEQGTRTSRSFTSLFTQKV